MSTRVPFISIATDFLNASGAGGSAHAALAEMEMVDAFLRDVADLDSGLRTHIATCRELLAAGADTAGAEYRKADRLLIIALGHALLQWFEIDRAAHRARMVDRSYTMADYESYKSRRLAEQRLAALPAGLGHREPAPEEPPMPPPILFLDFDGVLHPEDVYLVRGRPTLRGEGELFMWAPILSDLLQGREIRIVLSTSWARHLGYDRARSYLPDAIAERVVGATWHSGMRRGGGILPMQRTWWDEASRYEQIARYVARAGCTSWIAIEDDVVSWPSTQRRQLVETNGALGMSCPRVQERLAELLEDPPYCPPRPVPMRAPTWG